MGRDLRIPLKSEQKALIVEATKDQPEGVAALARVILLVTSLKRLAEKNCQKADRDCGFE